MQLTHIIKYWIPFDDNGGTTTTTIDFSKDTQLETIFGLLFMIGVRCVPDFEPTKFH